MLTIKDTIWWPVFQHHHGRMIYNMNCEWRGFVQRLICTLLSWSILIAFSSFDYVSVFSLVLYHFIVEHEDKRFVDLCHYLEESKIIRCVLTFTIILKMYNITREFCLHCRIKGSKNWKCFVFIFHKYIQVHREWTVSKDLEVLFNFLIKK